MPTMRPSFRSTPLARGALNTSTQRTIHVRVCERAPWFLPKGPARKGRPSTGTAAARDPAAPYGGMTEAQIIACAGEPHSRFKSGAGKETLTYHKALVTIWL